MYQKQYGGCGLLDSGIISRSGLRVPAWDHEKRVNKQPEGGFLRLKGDGFGKRDRSGVSTCSLEGTAFDAGVP